MILSDGVKWIETATRKVFAGMRLTFVLDLFHVLEKLGDALKEMMPDVADRKAAFERMNGWIKAGNAALVVEELAPRGRRRAAVGDFVRIVGRTATEFGRANSVGAASHAVPTSSRAAAGTSSSTGRRRAVSAGRWTAQTGSWPSGAAR